MKMLSRMAVVAGLLLATAACSRVEPGNVGIRVSNFGDRGVQEQVVEPGKWIYNGPGYQLYEFPTFKQNHVYRDAEAISFGTVEGLNVEADIGISYRIQPSMAVKLFQDYRKGVAEITAVDMRNAVQNAFVVAGGKRKIETVYGAGKAELIAQVKESVSEKMRHSGIQIDDIYWSGNPRLPANVTKSINAKIQATQMAEQRQNEVAQAQAEAEKEVAKATGLADAKLLSAKAEAEAIQIKGEALRNNPALIELERVNAMKIAASRWDGAGGIVPQTVMGGDTPLIFQMPAK